MISWLFAVPIRVSPVLEPVIVLLKVDMDFGVVPFGLRLVERGNAQAANGLMKKARNRKLKLTRFYTKTLLSQQNQPFHTPWLAREHRHQRIDELDSTEDFSTARKSLIQLSALNIGSKIAPQIKRFLLTSGVLKKSLAKNNQNLPNSENKSTLK